MKKTVVLVLALAPNTQTARLSASDLGLGYSHGVLNTYIWPDVCFLKESKGKSFFSFTREYNSDQRVPLWQGAARLGGARA